MAPNSTDTSPQAEEELMDACLLNGRFLSHPLPGDEICISGMSGVFPNSENIDHFKDNIFKKMDLLDDDCRRWQHVHPGIPQRTGKIFDIEKFDAGFFGVHHRQANSMDPMVRIFLEKSVEAIFDAGLHPYDLEGTRTGVFVGACFSETEINSYFENSGPQQFGITGCIRSMIPNRVSYYLKLKSPSYVSDTACSSSSYALENAFSAIRNGVCDMAIVGGVNLTLHPFVSLQFARLGVLSDDGRCKSFDVNGNGYARSESVVCIFLQKAKDCRRIYANIVHVKTNCDGYKQEGITFPSREMQTQLLQEFYKECQVDSTTLTFLEAHATGTKVGDPEEISAIDEVFCTGRKTPLLVGSVKSNIGHSEPASGLCSIVKGIICIEEEYIPPNIHFTEPRKGVKALEDGRLKVVTEKTPLPDDKGLIGVNCFGFGGGNSHVLLKWNTKVKVKGGEPNDDLPRLVCVSGRTPEAISALTEDVNSRKLDAEHVQLLHEIFKRDISEHQYRGYTICSKSGEIKTSFKQHSGETPPLLLAFGSFENDWQNFCLSLSQIPTFVAAVQRVHDILANRGVNITKVIQGSEVLDPVISSILGNTVLQIGVMEILKELEIKPNAIMGYAIGDVMCAYFDGSLSLEQTVLTAYEIAGQVKDIIKPTSTFFVKLDEYQVRKLLPSNIEVIWKNSVNSVTISGEPNAMQNFVKMLQKKGIDVEEISTGVVTTHSEKIVKIESILLPKLKKIIPKPKQKSSRWLSASIEKASPEHFIKALHSQIYFQDISGKICKDQLVIEIGVGSFSKLLKQTVGRSLEIIKFQTDQKASGLVSLLKVLGSLYEHGFNPQIQRLYPKIHYPVSRGTPMISPKIKWDHSKNWHVTIYKQNESVRCGENALDVTLLHDDWQYIGGHVIDGRILFPATGYIHTVWNTLSRTINALETGMNIVFEDCRFNRATTISKDHVAFTIMIQRSSGNFEIIESGNNVVSGKVYVINDSEITQVELPQRSGSKKLGNFPLTTKDVYKELRLRGYNYKGAFRGIQRCNTDASVAWIKWDGNWVSFMDNMLQIKILQLDTRLLYVPTSIKKLSIDAKAHLQYVESFGDNPILPVYNYKHADIIRCGGIEIKGLLASSIVRRKQRGEPVLEKYEFVPNEINLSLAQSIRVNMQIGLENLYDTKLKVVELIDDATEEGTELLSPIILEAFGDQPLIQATVSILSKEKLEVPNITVENKNISSESDCSLIVGSKIFQRGLVLNEALKALKEKGFILSREGLDFDLNSLTDEDQVDIVTVFNTGNEKLVYFRKTIEEKEGTLINVSETDQEFSWLRSLQTAMKNDNHVVIYSQNEELSGILGLFNCLRREPGGTKVKCFLILGENSPAFDPRHPFYSKQLKKNMAVNIFINGQWGTYRHLLIEHLTEVESEHCFINSLTRGDLSSLRWIEGPLNLTTILPPEQTMVQVYYASLNFRDIMTASGRINVDVITADRTQQECVQGFEFVGRDTDGRRVMGMTAQGALSTLLASDKYLLWSIPDMWTMEQAATIPVVYGTVLYALIKRGKVKKGDSILIHSGTGGVGQAAINVALGYGCTVFTTVGTPEKRELIKKLFPQLTDRHIGNSRDITFENMIKKETNGRGVDLVLNSLAEEKLMASVRCLAKGGKFLEIGKFDLANNNELSLLLMAKECSFHGVMLDKFFLAHPSLKKDLGNLLEAGFKSGSIRPLTTNVFKMNEIEKAFRFMSSGKHTGKVMIQIREEESEKIAIPPSVKMQGVARYSCSPERSYIIIGGLGGFGLELADWLILRGAKKLVLTSRSGIQTGYQFYRLKVWKTYDCIVKVSTADITTREGCEQLITEAEQLDPIQSIFNLAVVLKDSLLENQSPETFKISFAPKAVSTKYLDEITRRRCPELRDFVIFSSVSCGRGNAGQTNYGMSNSIMERICEKRKREGYPALAIEWGAVGDVGLVAEMMEEENTEIEIGGTLQQKIRSCLEVMDGFLRQTEAPVVSSMVVAEKRSGSGGADSILDVVVQILGVKKQSVSPHANLAELGMDSMTAIEIKLTLEREFKVFLTAQDIRSLTLAKLEEIQQGKESESEAGTVHQRPRTVIGMIIRDLGDENLSKIPIIQLPSLVESNSDAPYLFCFPGIEGFVTTLKPLAARLRAKIVGIQFCSINPTRSYKDMSLESVVKIEKYLEPHQPLHIVSYSWGSIIALETLSKLEKKGYKGTLTCIDGAPDMLVEMCKQEIKTESDAEFDTALLCHLMRHFMPDETILENKEKIYKCKNFEERLEVVTDITTEDVNHSPQYQRLVATAFHSRLKELLTYKPDYPKIQSPTRLFKPSVLSVPDFPDDYNISKLCANLIEVKIFEGDHITILENIELADALNEILGVK